MKTDLFIVLNEETLNTLKGKGNKTAKFATAMEADDFASTKLNLWCVVKVCFNHPFINHTL
jgi:hypothetical protein